MLAPVWEAVTRGEIDEHDPDALLAAVGALPERPNTAAIKALDDAVRDDLTRWEAGGGRAALLGELVAVAQVNLACARLEQSADLLRCTVATGARSLYNRYRSSGDPADLAQWISMSEEAVRLTPSGPELAKNLNNLALAERYARGGELADLGREVELFEEAVRLTPAGPDRAKYVSNLAAALGQRYVLRGDPADLGREIELAEAALRLAPNRPDRPQNLCNLATALGYRYFLSGDPADLDRPIKLLDEAVRLTPGGPDRAMFLGNLAVALAGRYALRGDPADLTREVALLEVSVQRTQGGPWRALYLDHLAVALVELWLKNLEVELGDRYALGSESAGLARPIDLLEEAVACTPCGPWRATYLDDLANVLGYRYVLSGDVADLARRIALLEEALARTPTGPNIFRRLNNLAVALRARHMLSGDRADLERALGLWEAALNGEGVARIPTIARTLAEAYLALAEHLPLVSRLAAAARAAGHGTDALERLLAVATEADEAALLRRFGDLHGLALGCTLRLALLAEQEGERVAADQWRAQAFAVAEHAKDRRAAALLAAPGVQPNVVAAQRLLPDIERLRAALAQLYRRLAAEGGGGEEQRSAAPREALEEQAERVWRELAGKLAELARSDPQYASLRGFAQPQPLEAVAAAIPAGGALVLLYPLDEDLAVFVLRPAAEPGGSPNLAADLVPFSLSAPHAETGDVATLGGKAALERLVERVVATAIPVGLVLDSALGTLARALYTTLAPLLPPPDAAASPNLVLVPTGTLHRLPLHALPWPSKANRLCDGYAVSYVSSVDVLPLSADRPAASTGLVALAPGLAGGSGDGELAGALAEAATVGGLAQTAPLLRRQANLHALLAEQVLDQCRFGLAATHGMAGSGEHGRAGLLFYDERAEGPAWLTAAEVLARLRLRGMEHLDVGACATHALDPLAGDRLAGLVQALLYKGARSVGVTLWPVSDVAAALVGTWTFEALLGGEQDKARALRAAVRRLRESKGAEAATELRWLAAALPRGDPARHALEDDAAVVGEQSRPFARTAVWAPFVLHGAPRIAILDRAMPG